MLCRQPVRQFVNRTEFRLHRCRRRWRIECPHCAALHKGDVQEVMEWRAEGFVWARELTLTQPGGLALLALAAWILGAPKAFSYVKQTLVRCLNVGVSPRHRIEMEDLAVAWVKEDINGVPHWHVTVVCRRTIGDRRWRAAVQRMCRQRSFGTHRPTRPIRDAKRWAGYQVKTVGESLLDKRTGELRPIGGRQWGTSKNWGKTLRDIHMDRLTRALAKGCPIPLHIFTIPEPIPVGEGWPHVA